MPNNPSIHRATRPLPVPVGLFLASTSRQRRHAVARPGVPDWHGLSPGNLAYLIRRYTRVGDVVLDIDQHPTVAAAARYLRRAPATLVTQGGTRRVRLVPPPPHADRPRRVVCRPGPGADLIVVTLPRSGADSVDLHTMTHTMATWRRLLRPGGHLIAAMATRGREPTRISFRSTVIAAGRPAGLVYHQHIPVLLVALPERDPRTEPVRPGDADDGPQLLAGRHLPVFHNVLVFAGTATGEETTCA